MLYLGNSKRCTKCGKYKDMATEYYKSAANVPSGVKSRCKACESERVRKYKDREDRFWKSYWSRVVRVGECLEWRGAYDGRARGRGRGSPVCCWYGKSHTSVRRVVYSLAIGNLADDKFVLTKCNNRQCVRQSHMYLGTREDKEVKRASRAAVGLRHRSQTRPDRTPRGEQSNFAKLKESDIPTIRMRSQQGESSVAIARSFHVSYVAIWQILRGKTWKHVRSEVDNVYTDFIGRGERHGMSKLKEVDIPVIRARHQQGESNASIARSFGVAPSCISQIICGRTWKHVQ